MRPEAVLGISDARMGATGALNFYQGEARGTVIPDWTDDAQKITAAKRYILMIRVKCFVKQKSSF